MASKAPEGLLHALLLDRNGGATHVQPADIENWQPDEGLLWLYTEPVGHRGSVLTSMKIAGWTGTLRVSVPLAEVVWAEFVPGQARERIRIGRRDGEVVELEFASGAESERLYATLCDRVGARCS